MALPTRGRRLRRQRVVPLERRCVEEVAATARSRGHTHEVREEGSPSGEGERTPRNRPLRAPPHTGHLISPARRSCRKGRREANAALPGEGRKAAPPLAHPPNRKMRLPMRLAVCPRRPGGTAPLTSGACHVIVSESSTCRSRRCRLPEGREEGRTHARCTHGRAARERQGRRGPYPSALRTGTAWCRRQ